MAEIPIGGRIRATRLARGLTLGQVAAAAGLTQGFVSKLERDQVSPSVASLVAITRRTWRTSDEFEALEELKALFDEEARRNNVYPIQDTGAQSRAMKMASWRLF